MRASPLPDARTKEKKALWPDATRHNFARVPPSATPGDHKSTYTLFSECGSYVVSPEGSKFRAALSYGGKSVGRSLMAGGRKSGIGRRRRHTRELIRSGKCRTVYQLLKSGPLIFIHFDFQLPRS